MATIEEKQPETEMAKIRKVCEDNGIKITHVFKRAGIDTDKIYRWTRSNPAAVSDFVKITAIVNDMILEKQQEGDV